MRRKLAVLALCACAPWAADAQFEGRVTVTLTDPGTGLPVSQATPGQIVRMRTIVSWLPGPVTQLAGIAGDLTCTPAGAGGVGLITNRFSEFQPGGLVNLGVLSGDDVLGLDIAVTPSLFMWGWAVPPTGNFGGIAITGYD